MRVILLRDIRTLGKKGEVREVADGYARNVLIPKKLVEQATPALLKMLTVKQSLQKEKNELERQKLAALAADFKNRFIEFQVQADEAGSIFGSITKAIIEKAIREHGWITKERVHIILDHPIKKCGEYRIALQFQEGISTVLTVRVQRRL